MTTNIQLPAGFEDWEELDGTYPQPLPTGQFIKIETRHYKQAGGLGRVSIPIVPDRYFVPPKPKPALPDVKPGAVVRYVDKTGKTIRAVYRSARVWDIYYQPHAPINTACHASVIGDDDVLAAVNADGFTVELEGL